jgi:hypothetical protein
VKFWIDGSESYGLMVAKVIEDGRDRGGGKEGMGGDASLGEA